MLVGLNLELNLGLKIEPFFMLTNVTSNLILVD